MGLALKPPVVISLPQPSLRLSVGLWINRLRWRVARGLAEDIAAIAPGAGEAARGLAVAVTTSHEGWLAPEAADDLRGSGLAHMLAIAGLHTAAVSGFVFAALRLGVALWPWLAVRASGEEDRRVRRPCGGPGLSDPFRRPSPSQACGHHRQRGLCRDPLGSAGHQSARPGYRRPDRAFASGPRRWCSRGFRCRSAPRGPWWRWRRSGPHRSSAAVGAPWPIRALQRAKDWTLALIAVSLVAGAATGPFAIQHFNRMANYGVPANFSADFVASAVMMPALALSLPAEALGLGREVLAVPLTIAAWAARLILEIGHLCATAPGASVTTPSAPAIAMLIAFLGIVFGILWKGRLRWLGVPPGLRRHPMAASAGAGGAGSPTTAMAPPSRTRE